jgi:HEAT repeat protein
LLKDPSEIVRLNALDACTRIRDAALEPDLVEASISTNPRIAEYGVRALASQGADSAKADVLRTLRIGVTDHSRAVAADAVADLKDPKLAGAIVVLLEHKSWVTRLAAVDALNKIAGREAAIMRSAFLSQADPEIKLAVTRDLDPTNDEQMRRALWSAVNEPSDAVRLWSDYKLILSPDATMRKEGYKGVRDDSAWVRAELLRLLASHPTEEYRAAYELGVADSAATVRAAALDGFAGLEKGATADEIQNALSDDNPKVQLALIRLAKAKSMKLPKSTVDAMLSSPDSNVVAAAKELSE